MPDPTASELITFFRAKAKEYEGLAKSIEEAARDFPATVNLSGKATLRVANSGTLTVTPSGQPTVEQVRQSILDKGARIADLVQRFGTAESVIKNIVSDPANGITVGNRGWLKVDAQQPLSFQGGDTEEVSVEKEGPNGANHPAQHLTDKGEALVRKVP
jgi:hypothetical protein